MKCDNYGYILVSYKLVVYAMRKYNFEKTSSLIIHFLSFISTNEVRGFLKRPLT
jgi:hypothetical protein